MSAASPAIVGTVYQTGFKIPEELLPPLIMEEFKESTSAESLSDFKKRKTEQLTRLYFDRTGVENIRKSTEMWQTLQELNGSWPKLLKLYEAA